MGGPFDVQALWAALDEQRRARATTWAAIGRATGVSPSTLTRTQHATDLEADGLVRMTTWLGRAPEAFCPGPAVAVVAPVDGPPLPRVDTAALHAALEARRTRDGLSWAEVAAALETDRATPTSLRALRGGGRVSTQVFLSATRWLDAPSSRFLVPSPA